MMMRLFYYLVAAPILLVLRLLFWPVKMLLRFFFRRQYFRSVDFDSMDGWEFEKFVAELLARNGFCHVEVTKGKHYASKIPNKAVQEAYAGARFYGCDQAVVLTNSYFTQSALELGDEIEVELWDREELQKLIRRARR